VEFRKAYVLCVSKKPSGIIYIIFIERFSFIIGYGQYKCTACGWATAIVFAIIGSLSRKRHRRIRKRTGSIYGWILLKSKRFGIRGEDEKRTFTCTTVSTTKYNGPRIGFTRNRTHKIYYLGVNIPSNIYTSAKFFFGR